MPLLLFHMTLHFSLYRLIPERRQKYEKFHNAHKRAPSVIFCRYGGNLKRIFRMPAKRSAHIWTVTLLEFIRNLSQEVLSVRQRHSVSWTGWQIERNPFPCLLHLHLQAHPWFRHVAVTPQIYIISKLGKIIRIFAVDWQYHLWQTE